MHEGGCGLELRSKWRAGSSSLLPPDYYVLLPFGPGSRKSDVHTILVSSRTCRSHFYYVVSRKSRDRCTSLIVPNSTPGTNTSWYRKPKGEKKESKEINKVKNACGW